MTTQSEPSESQQEPWSFLSKERSYGWDGKEMQEAGRLPEAPPRTQGAEGFLLVLCLFLRVAISLTGGLLN